MLDIACGGGRTVAKLAARASSGKTYGIDVSETSVLAARRANRDLLSEGRVEILEASVTALPFADGIFDVVTAVETHQILGDFEEVLRVLKPGGTFALITGSYRGVDEHEDRLTRAGFSVVEVIEECNKGWLCALGERVPQRNGDQADGPLQYRPAMLEDAPEIAALHAENWRRGYRGNFRDEYLDGDVHADRLRAWTARLQQPADHQFVGVALERARIVGFVCAFGAHDRAWGSFIDNLHVEAGSQRHGIGSGLMRQAGAWLSSHFPEERVHLLVWESNPARTLYERLGGHDTGMIEVENPGGGSGRYVRYVWERPSLLTP